MHRKLLDTININQFWTAKSGIGTYWDQLMFHNRHYSKQATMSCKKVIKSYVFVHGLYHFIFNKNQNHDINTIFTVDFIRNLYLSELTQVTKTCSRLVNFALWAITNTHTLNPIQEQTVTFRKYVYCLHIFLIFSQL